MAELNVHRMTDENSAGGAINSIPQSFVYENTLLISIDGSLGTSHPTCPTDSIHCAGNWLTANGTDWVLINSIAVNKKNDADTCSHIRSEGSEFVFIDS